MTDKNKEFWEDGSFYGEYVSEELNDERKNLWKERIRKRLKGSGSLRVLDIGCGPGFFSCILSEEGHRVTGIDLASNRNSKLWTQEPLSLKMVNLTL